MRGDAAELSRIRAQLDAIKPGLWSRVHDGAGEFVEAQGPMGELLEVFRFHAGATSAEMEFVVDAPRNIDFLLRLVDRAIAAMRPKKARKNFAAEAALKCKEPRFWDYLAACHGLERPLTEARATQRLRTLLGVASRKDLNDDDHAAERWKALRRDFETWKKRVG